ncbi:MAG: hypothetical protein PHY29_03555 [Syntrophales bacterium]|nr:hypothetical protein [Syntrophales bacterium]
MIHGDTKRLSLLEGQKALERREYLIVAIDDFSRDLYAAILPDNSSEECPYTIERSYGDNGKEYWASYLYEVMPG